ncbi:SRPBCC family protein [Candidatus Poribacteria bacterium]|nr:SRPBCC family protein [Candidatus Poribacteria bacterium]
MRIYNIHERRFDAPHEQVGALLDSLSGPDDKLWPSDKWPRMELDKPLGKGARGGHGPVRYTTVEYTPSQRAVFHLEDAGLTTGFDGRHFFEVVPRHTQTLLRHVLDARCNARAWLRWFFFVRPVHDALLEDALDHAELALTGRLDAPARWSLWVRFVRFIISRTAKAGRVEK